MNTRINYRQKANEVSIPVKRNSRISATLSMVEHALGTVMIAYGSGSGRFSSRHRYLAEELNNAGMSTLMVDLLTSDEQQTDLTTGEFRFNIELLTERITETTRWVCEGDISGAMKIGYFGDNSAAAAALSAAANPSARLKTVVCCSGRCDLAEHSIPKIKVPVLFIVGQYDYFIKNITENTVEKMTCENKVEIIEGATHRFEEPGANEEVAEAASKWFAKIMTRD